MPRRTSEVNAQYVARRRPLVEALGRPGADVIQKHLLKAILATDVCVSSYAALADTLLAALDRSKEGFRGTAAAISRDADAIEDSARKAAAAGPVAWEMQKAITVFKALTYDTLLRELTYESDFVKFVDLVADETALAVLSPPEPHLARAVLAVAWEKVIEDPVDAASLFVIAVVKEMREQLPDPGAAISYLTQLELYTTTALKAATFIEVLRQVLLLANEGQPDSVLAREVVESRATLAIKERAEALAQQFQS